MAFPGLGKDDQATPDTGDFLMIGYMYVFYMKDGRKVLGELLEIRDINGPGWLGILNKKVIGYRILRKFKDKIMNEKKEWVDKATLCRSHIKDEEVAEIVYTRYYRPYLFSQNQQIKPKPKPVITEEPEIQYEDGGF